MHRKRRRSACRGAYLRPVETTVGLLVAEALVVEHTPDGGRPAQHIAKCGLAKALHAESRKGEALSTETRYAKERTEQR